MSGYTFIWKIENFIPHFYNTGEVIISPDFIFEALNYSRWNLRLFPKGKKGESANHISIFLHRDDDEKDEEILIDYEIQVNDGNGELVETLNEYDKLFEAKQSWGSDKFIEREGLLSKINDWRESTLAVSCKLSCKNVDRPCVSGCEARTKLGFDRHYFERALDITDTSSSFSLEMFRLALNIKCPSDEFEIEVIQYYNNGVTSYNKIAFTISLLDVEGVEVITKRDFHTFYTNEYRSSESWKFPTFFSKSMLLNMKDTLLHRNFFTLRFEVSLPTGKDISTVTNYTRNTCSNSDFYAISELTDGLRALLTLKKHCDVKLRVEDQDISAHKNILAARSDVFSAMFDQDMLENKTGIVEIKDMTVDAVNNLLEFFYTGSMKGLDYDKALELLIAAEKYQVLSLKKQCSSFLVSIFAESNVLDVLATADIVGYSPLKTAAMDYIKKNYKAVVTTKKWPDWVKMNTALASEIIILLGVSTHCPIPSGFSTPDTTSFPLPIPPAPPLPFC